MKRGFLFLVLMLALLICTGSAFALETCFWTDCSKAKVMKLKAGPGEVVATPDLAIFPADFALNTDYVIPLTKAGKDVYGAGVFGTGADYTFLSVPNYFTDMKGIYIHTISENSANVYGLTAMVDVLGAANKYIIGLKLPEGLIVKLGPAIAVDIGHQWAPLGDIHFNFGYSF